MNKPEAIRAMLDGNVIVPNDEDPTLKDSQFTYTEGEFRKGGFLMNVNKLTDEDMYEIYVPPKMVKKWKWAYCTGDNRGTRISNDFHANPPTAQECVKLPWTETREEE